MQQSCLVVLVFFQGKSLRRRFSDRSDLGLPDVFPPTVVGSWALVRLVGDSGCTRGGGLFGSPSRAIALAKNATGQVKNEVKNAVKKILGGFWAKVEFSLSEFDRKLWVLSMFFTFGSHFFTAIFFTFGCHFFTAVFFTFSPLFFILLALLPTRGRDGGNHHLGLPGQ